MEKQTGNRTKMNGFHGKYMVVLYTKPMDCGGNCLYCIKSDTVTRSTVANEDTLLAADNGWSSTKQFLQRCADEGIVLGTGNKFELRIKGNSFTNYPCEYLEGFIKDIYDLLNGYVAESFEAAFAGQQTAPDKVVQIVIETRPDQITRQWCEQMQKWGVTTVEIGVQSLNDSVLANNTRGHLTDAVERAAALIRENGFELGYQVMLGLYTASRAMDKALLTQQLWDEKHYPDTLKIYPCLLLPDKNAQKPLYALFEAQKWVPMSNAYYMDFLREVVPTFPKDVHVNRLQRIFTEDEVAFGPKKIIDRSVFENDSHCMWQRSIQNRKAPPTNYDDISYVHFRHGGEYCIQAVLADDTLLGYARLSMRGTQAVIRDLRVLGAPVPIGQRSEGYLAVQHRGIGKAMMAYMETLASQLGAGTVTVYSSAGCVAYFASLGYEKIACYCLQKQLSGDERF